MTMRPVPIDDELSKRFARQIQQNNARRVQSGVRMGGFNSGLSGSMYAVGARGAMVMPLEPPVGSLYGAGSMYGGMGAAPGAPGGGLMPIGGSMYGMGSMYGINGSQPASLLNSDFGSFYGLGRSGSMMGGPLMTGGSMYGLGFPMGGGSMYGLGGMGGMGSGYGGFGSMGSQYGGSMYGSNMYGGGGYGAGGGNGLQTSGSFYGPSVSGPPMSGGGSNNSNNAGPYSFHGLPNQGAADGANNTTSLYGMPNGAGGDMGAAPKGPGAGVSAYNTDILQQKRNSVDSNGGNNGFYNTGDAGAPSGADAAAAAAKPKNGVNGAAANSKSPASKPANGTSAATATKGDGESVGSRGSRSGKENIAGVVLVTQPATLGAVNVRADGGQSAVAITGQPPITMDSVAGPAQGTPAAVAAVAQTPFYTRAVADAVLGHNVGVCIGYADTKEDNDAVQGVVSKLLNDIVAGLEAEAGRQPNGYFDCNLFACAFKNEKRMRDLVGEGVQGAYKAPRIGSHPVFGPSFTEVTAMPINESAQGAISIKEVLDQVFYPVQQKDSPVIILQLINKQVRDTPAAGSGDKKGAASNEPTVLLSSATILLSNAHETDSHPFFDALRTSDCLPTSLTKGVLGGACSTFALLSLSSATAAPAAMTAMAGLMDLRSIQNSPARSGNLSRFIKYATTESQRLREKPNAVRPDVLKNVDQMLADGNALLKDPRNTTPKCYYVSSSRSNGSGGYGAARSNTRAANVSASSGGSGGTNASGTAGAVRTVAYVSTDAPGGAAPNFSVAGNVITDAASGSTLEVDEVVQRAASDWTGSGASKQAGELQKLFHSGSNTALLGACSQRSVNELDKQPLWMTYKKMLSSLLTSGSKQYSLCEVSLCLCVITGETLVEDLLQGMENAKGARGENAGSRPLAVAFSPLFGPTIHHATTLKPPSPLQLESTVNSALFQAATLLAKTTPADDTVVFASTVMKGVTKSDVLVCSLTAVGAAHPEVLTRIAAQQSTLPGTLFQYAVGGPCTTLAVVDLTQGDANGAAAAAMLKQLALVPNRPSRSCSVQNFVHYAEESLASFDAKMANAKSDRDRAHVAKNRKTMEVFYAEYKALLDDPVNRDAKAFRKTSSRGAHGDGNSANGGNTSEGAAPGNGDGASQDSGDSTRASTRRGSRASSNHSKHSKRSKRSSSSRAHRS